MKIALPLWIVLASTSAHAECGRDAQCANAAATLNAVVLALDPPAQTKTAEAVVEFAIGSNGAIGDAAAAPPDPALAAPAVAAVERLSCRPEATLQRFLLPVFFGDLRCERSAQPRQVRVPHSFKVD